MVLLFIPRNHIFQTLLFKVTFLVYAPRISNARLHTYMGSFSVIWRAKSNEKSTLLIIKYSRIQGRFQVDSERESHEKLKSEKT